MDYYTGIGSRETPIEILKIMQDLGHYYATKGVCLRSGGADGADSAFEAGCDMAKGSKRIYIPWPGFNKRFENEPGIILATKLPSWNKALKIMEKTHLAFYKLTQGAKKLHGRNVYQVLGETLNVPSKVIFCYTKDAKEIGGTATAIRIGKKLNIKIVNLGDPVVAESVVNMLRSKGYTYKGDQK